MWRVSVGPWITTLKVVFTRFDAFGGVAWYKWKSMLPEKWLPGVSGMPEGPPPAPEDSMVHLAP